MKRLASAIMVAGALMLANTAPVKAHDNGRNIYKQQYNNQHYRYRTINVRNRGMPSWLRHRFDFRTWYRHSDLRTNRYLTWSELYQIYHWERSYSTRRYKRSHAYSGHRNYDWYRRYWNKQRDRHAHKRRDRGRRH